MNKRLISNETVVFDHPPSRNELMKKSHDELFDHLVDIGIPQVQLELISDKDKRKTYMIEETLRLEKPFPKPQPPVLMSMVFDAEKNEKILRYKYVKHLFKDEKNQGKYYNSVVSIEEYKNPLLIRDIKINEKKCLINDIKNEISKLNLDEWKTKSDIMKFACENGKSNTEKKRRAIELQKELVRNNYKRHRITHFDISVY